MKVLKTILALLVFFMSMLTVHAESSYVVTITGVPHTPQTETYENLIAYQLFTNDTYGNAFQKKKFNEFKKELKATQFTQGYAFKDIVSVNDIQTILETLNEQDTYQFNQLAYNYVHKVSHIKLDKLSADLQQGTYLFMENAGTESSEHFYNRKMLFLEKIDKDMTIDLSQYFPQQSISIHDAQQVSIGVNDTFTIHVSTTLASNRQYFDAYQIIYQLDIPQEIEVRNNDVLTTYDLKNAEDNAHSIDIECKLINYTQPITITSKILYSNGCNLQKETQTQQVQIYAYPLVIQSKNNDNDLIDTQLTLQKKEQDWMTIPTASFNAGIAAGQYRILQTNVPNDYIPNEDIYFTIQDTLQEEPILQSDNAHLSATINHNTITIDILTERSTLPPTQQPEKKEETKPTEEIKQPQQTTQPQPTQQPQKQEESQQSTTVNTSDSSTLLLYAIVCMISLGIVVKLQIRK